MTHHTPVAERLERARAAMRSTGADALCLSVGSDLPYLTGYRAMPLERLTMLVVTEPGDAVLVVPELEAPRVDAGEGAFAVRSWGETEDPVAIVDGLLGGASTAAIGDETWATFLLRLQAAGERRWVSAGPLMRSLRIVKDASEVAALRAAAGSADAVGDEMRDVRWSGRTERAVAREFAERLYAHGHESVEFTIVASGPNGASPHHESGERVIQPGDAVVADFGGHQAGYSSDTTRMFVVGDAPHGFVDAYGVLRRAQEAAVAAVGPGVPASSIDVVARSIIADAGFGGFFIHRTGHGIGMDTHEHPYLVDGDDTELRSGMAFSVEPGIYVEGKWGMRLEDIVVVTDDGVESLNTADHDIRFVE